MSKKLWAKRVGSILSPLSLLIGLAGIPEDVITWGSWISSAQRYAQQDVPWWVFILVSFVLAGFTWGPAWVGNFRSKSSVTPTQEDAATERLAVFFRATAEPASNKAYELLGKISRLLMNEKGKGSAESYVGILIQRFVADAQRTARALLAQAFLTREEGRPRDYSREEVQHLFGSYYEKYQWMTTWIHQAGKLIGFSFDTDQTYRQWRKADDEFLRELRRLIAERDFKVLEQEVNAKGWQENFREV